MIFALGVIKHIDVDGHARGIGVKPLDDDWKVNGVDGIDYQAVLFEMFDQIGGGGALV